jgi:hypothetical protein
MNFALPPITSGKGSDLSLIIRSRLDYVTKIRTLRTLFKAYPEKFYVFGFPETLDALEEALQNLSITEVVSEKFVLPSVRTFPISVAMELYIYYIHPQAEWYIIDDLLSYPLVERKLIVDSVNHTGFSQGSLSTLTLNDCKTRSDLIKLLPQLPDNLKLTVAGDLLRDNHLTIQNHYYDENYGNSYVSNEYISNEKLSSLLRERGEDEQTIQDVLNMNNAIEAELMDVIKSTARLIYLTPSAGFDGDVLPPVRGVFKTQEGSILYLIEDDSMVVEGAYSKYSRYMNGEKIDFQRTSSDSIIDLLKQLRTTIEFLRHYGLQIKRAFITTDRDDVFSFKILSLCSMEVAGKEKKPSNPFPNMGLLLDHPNEEIRKLAAEILNL